MFTERYHRKSVRQPDHHYDWAGAYFITICCKHREPLFDIPELKNILRETWEALPARFPVTLDEFVIMPNHVHFILRMHGHLEKPIPLWQIIGAYKSVAAVAWLKYVKVTNANYPGVIWQRGYNERSIRDAHQLTAYRQYIRNNPSKLGPEEPRG
jgi:putative transposase